MYPTWGTVDQFAQCVRFSLQFRTQSRLGECTVSRMRLAHQSYGRFVVKLKLISPDIVSSLHGHMERYVNRRLNTCMLDHPNDKA